MIELILIIAVWLVSYFTLPKILNLYSDELDEKTVNPVQKINFGTINAILFLLVVIITMGSPVIGEEKKTFELRIPQENQQECLKSAKTFKFSLPVISIDTRCEPRRDNEDPSMLST